MRARRASRARSSLVLPLAGFAVVTAVGLGLLIWWAGNEEPPASAEAPPGTRAVPVAGRALPAYRAIELEDLLDPRTGKLTRIYLPEDSILPETMTDARQLLGRVLGRDKAPGRVFREPDFLPEGTRPGIVAGIPTGKVALRIPSARVTGSVGLHRGDRFDLVATWPRNDRGAARPTTVLLGRGARAQVDVVAEGAAVVEPLAERRLPGAGGRPGGVVQELVIAVAPGEVPGVTEALELAARIDCVPHSGRPDEPSADEVARSAGRVDRGAFGRSRETVVETIVGGQRTLLEVPGAVVVPRSQELPAVSSGAPAGFGS